MSAIWRSEICCSLHDGVSVSSVTSCGVTGRARLYIRPRRVRLFVGRDWHRGMCDVCRVGDRLVNYVVQSKE